MGKGVTWLPPAPKPELPAVTTVEPMVTSPKIVRAHLSPRIATIVARVAILAVTVLNSLMAITVAVEAAVAEMVVVLNATNAVR